jgi:hypothetical protein
MTQKFTGILTHLMKKLLPAIIILLLLFWALGKWKGWPSPADWFKAKAVQIDETPLIISEIKTIAELHTAKLYCEVVTDSVVISTTDAAYNALRDAIFFPPLPPSFSTTKKLVLVAKGNIIAGMDLGQLSENDIKVNKDSVWISLPSAKILEVITNPSDFEIFMEEGTWNSAEVVLVKQKAIRQMEAEAAKRQLIAQANTRATMLMKNFLLASGFRHAEIQIK